MPRWAMTETKALWRVHPHINDSADFVMYWWDHAAEIVAHGKAQRFGFVTTNSHHASIQPPRGCPAFGGEKAGIAFDGDPGSSLDESDR